MTMRMGEVIRRLSLGFEKALGLALDEHGPEIDARFAMSAMVKTACCVTLLATLCPASVSLAGVSRSAGGGGPTIIYVDAAATGANDGTSWVDAYTDLQTALGAATSGTEIWVAGGTYTPGLDRSSTFQLKNGVELYGGFPPGGVGTMDTRDPWRYTTILSGEIGDPGLETDNVYHVLTGSGTDASAILDGFQVTAGHATLPGVYNGGGLLNVSGSPTIRNVVFLRNYAAGFGGAVENFDSSPTMENVIFHGNRAGWHGGAVDNYKDSHPEICNAIFVGNTAPQGGGVNNGDTSSPILRNVTMVANEADSPGGGISTDDTSSTAVMNSILWNNDPDQVSVAAGGTTSIHSSIVQEGCPLGATCDDVLSDDPLFLRMPSSGVASQAGPPPPSWGDADDHYGDLRLESGSPAIDSGNNAMVRPGITTDLMGNPRLADGLEAGLAAMGGGSFVVDRGAYEAPPLPIYVDQSAGGINSGYSWAHAFNDLQDAFLWGRSGVAEIWVAQGTYRPGELRTSTFQLLDGMAVYGGFPPGGGDGTFGARDLTTLLGSELSGDVGPLGLHDNVYHVVTASDVNVATLDGLRITGGNADGIFSGHGFGGGIYAPQGHPQLTNVTFRDNHAGSGGGGAFFEGSDASLSNCHFFDNSTVTRGGGLLFLNGGRLQIRDGSFRANDGGYFGGGLAVSGGRVTVVDAEFWENKAVYGGGIFADEASAYVSSVTFARNSATGWGGGIIIGLDSELTMSDSVFTLNGAGMAGGGLAGGGTSLTVSNVTFSGNRAGTDGGGVDLAETNATLNNTILWGNTASGVLDQVHVEESAALTCNHTIIQGGCPAGAACDHVLVADPLFYVDPDAGDDGVWGTWDDEPGDLRVWKTSPAIDAGDSWVVGFDRWDIEGNPRIVDVASVPDTGVGPWHIVDIGAYESPPDTVYVDQTATGAHSGLTWTDAFTDVQEALAWGASGATDAWVAQGVYTPGPERDDAFHLTNGVSLYGGFPAEGGDGTFDVRDWRTYTTTLSGEIGVPGDRSDNSYHVLVARSVDLAAWVDGFVVTRGSADVAPPFQPGPATCEYDTDYGGGLCLYDSEPVLTNLVFRDNYAIKGGGVEASESSVLMFNVEFVANQAGENGGGLHSYSSHLSLINAMFAGNHAASGGGALWSESSFLTILNTTISGNQAGTGSALRNLCGSDVTLTNAILWGNTSNCGPSIWSEEGCTLTARHSLLEGGCPADAACSQVLNLDPVFVRDSDPGADGVWGTGDDDLGDMQLEVTSPAIDAGDSDAFPDTLTTDLLGNPRFVEIDAIPNTGIGDVPIDMGAYEFSNDPPAAADDGYTTAEDTPLTVAAPGVLANDSDPDGSPLTAVLDSPPTPGGLMWYGDGAFVYTPAPDHYGVVTFTYHAHDGTASSNVATVAITVTAVNNPPTISDVPNQLTSPGTAVGPVPFAIEDEETPADALTLSTASSDTALVPVGNIVFGGSGANRTVTVTPAAGMTGYATITITVDDGTDTASDAFVLTVEPFRLHLPLILRGVGE